MGVRLFSSVSVWLCTALLVVVVLGSCKSSQPAVVSQPPVPVQPAPAVKAAPAAEPIPVKKSVKMKVALVMSFELAANFNPDTSDGSMAELEITPGSLPAIHFYEGARLAVDSLLKDSILVTLQAFDVPGDSAATARLFGGALLRDFDYVVTSLPQVLAPVAATAASKSGIRLILMQAPVADVVAGRPNVALAQASTFTQCRVTASSLAELYPSSHFIVVSRKLKRENELAEEFRSVLQEKAGPGSVSEFDATTRSVEELKKILKTDRRNVVVMASSDEAFIKNALSSINDLQMSGIYICGLPTWAGFETIDFMALENLRFFIFDNNFTDAADPGVNAFRKLFISTYSSDPMPQGYNGFDLVLGLGKERNGSLCERLVKAFSSQSRYRFKTDAAGDGCENQQVSLLELTDYSLKRIR